MAPSSDDHLSEVPNSCFSMCSHDSLKESMTNLTEPRPTPRLFVATPTARRRPNRSTVAPFGSVWLRSGRSAPPWPRRRQPRSSHSPARARRRGDPCLFQGGVCWSPSWSAGVRIFWEVSAWSGWSGAWRCEKVSLGGGWPYTQKQLEMAIGG